MCYIIGVMRNHFNTTCAKNMAVRYDGSILFDENRHLAKLVFISLN